MRAAPIRIGLAGGNFGLRVLAPALRRAGFEIAGFVAGSPVSAQAAAACGIARVIDGLDALLAEVDAVALAVPPALCAEWTAAAVARGVAVLAEKPLAPTALLARALVRDGGPPVAVDFAYAELLPFQALRRVVADRRLGAVRRVQVAWRARTRDGALAPAWKRQPEAGGGVLGLYGVHVLHAAEWLFGPLDAIGAVRDGAAERSVAFCGTFQGGALLGGELSMDAAGESFQRWEVGFEGGTAVLDNIESRSVAGFRLVLRDGQGGVLESHDDPEAAMAGLAVPVARLAARFAQALRSGASFSPGAAEAARALALAEATRAARPPAGP